MNSIGKARDHNERLRLPITSSCAKAESLPATETTWQVYRPMSVFLTDLMVRLPSEPLSDSLPPDSDGTSSLPTNQRQLTSTDESFSTPQSSVTRDALIAAWDWGGRTILVLTTTNTKQSTSQHTCSTCSTLPSNFQPTWTASCLLSFNIWYDTLWQLRTLHRHDPYLRIHSNSWCNETYRSDLNSIHLNVSRPSSTSRSSAIYPASKKPGFHRPQCPLSGTRKM